MLYTFKYCGCGDYEIFTDTLSDSIAEFSTQSWYPQVLRFSIDQKKVFLEAPQFSKIPEFMVVGDYNMETGKVNNRKYIYKKDVWNELVDIRDAQFSKDGKYVYFTAGSERANVYQLDINTMVFREVEDTGERVVLDEGFWDLELGPDGYIYIGEVGRSKQVLDFWRVVDADSSDAYIELAYRNTNFKKYPNPPFGFLPDIPSFLYDPNYRFPEIKPVPLPQINPVSDQCFTSSQLLSNRSHVSVDSTVWQLRHNSNYINRFTGDSIMLENMPSGNYTATVTNYIKCRASEPVTINFELDSFPTLILSKDTLILCGTKGNREKLEIISNTASGIKWHTKEGMEVVSFSDTGVYVATASNHCGVQRDTLVQQQEKLNIPNIITPNGDGKNETLQVTYSENIPIRLSIYNRWGSLIYLTPDYLNEWPVSPINSGIYYYEIITQQDCQYKGWVQLEK